MWISSDTESGSDIDDMDSGDGCRDVDDRRSDDALSSVNASVASITKASPRNAGHNESLSYELDDGAGDMCQLGTPVDDRADWEAATDIETPRALSPTLSRAPSIMPAISHANEAAQAAADDSNETPDGLPSTDLHRRMIEKTQSHSQTPHSTVTRCVKDWSDPRPNSDAGDGAQKDQAYDASSPSPDLPGGGKGGQDDDDTAKDTAGNVGQRSRKRRKVNESLARVVSRRRE
ncbi:hypothetical protein DL766_008950 [Monosporascus sp. MC13-8B]|uniref:BZIP domain-containing protein n=1 Tax=Monosporascus cannonballus TaxID=155416 RepID=A0ABY0HI56_9PEZI|nr:hypothetical protein DL762_001243 [Monosporascus cannonballus]RYO99676.1 hypothetical protein DL763_001284 [Monosporascus cannonballus]RYP17228.1 hypothetical protein DL766_008950 [Monosporascus sp. MC13-8B]